MILFDCCNKIEEGDVDDDVDDDDDDNGLCFTSFGMASILSSKVYTVLLVDVVFTLLS